MRGRGRIGNERVMDNNEQPVKPQKIDFTALDKVQYVANLGDQRRLYSAEDPGREYARNLPVYLNQYGTRHLISDDTHFIRIAWIGKNAEDFTRCIANPDIIEKVIRSRTDGHFSLTNIVKVSTPGERNWEYMVVSISLSKGDSGYHQITTIHPKKYRELFRSDGQFRANYIWAK